MTLSRRTPLKIHQRGHAARGTWALCLLLTTVVCVGTSTAATFQVQVGGDAPNFSPSALTVQAGDTVEWVWASSGFHHSVTSGINGKPDGRFDSAIHTDPFTFTYTFPSVGTFNYYCQPHLSMGMTGQVTVTAAATPTPTPAGTPGILGNISTRLQVGTGNNVLFAGFIVQGNALKKVLIRSAGPSLTQFGVTGALTNPQMELHDASSTIGRNDNWQTTQLGGVITSDQAAEIQNSGFAPRDPNEPVIIATLPPAGYTTIVQGAGDVQGVATVELYDLSPNNGANLANISTRGFAQTNDNVLIGGFIVVGQPLKVMIRATGPSLSSFGISNALANPRLELHDGNGTLTANNDNWQSTQIGGIITSDQSAAIQSSGLAPSNPAESAVMATLPAGAYTAVVQGVNSGTGIAVVEVYTVP